MVDPRRWKTKYRTALFAVAVVGATAGLVLTTFSPPAKALLCIGCTHFWRDAVQSAIIGAVIPSFLFYAWHLLRN